MLVYQKTMFGRYYCIKSLILEKMLQKYYNGAQKHEGFVGFEKACSRAKTCKRHHNVTNVRSFLCMLLLMTSIFVTA